MKHLILPMYLLLLVMKAILKWLKTVNILEFSRTRESPIIFESRPNPTPSLTPAL